MTALWKVLKLVDGVLVIHAGLACFNEEQIGGRRERNVDGSMIGRVVCIVRNIFDTFIKVMPCAL